MRTAYLLAFVLTPLVACDSGSGELGRGEFEAAVSGDIDVMFSGTAEYSRDDVGTLPVIVLDLSEGGLSRQRSFTLTGVDQDFRSGVEHPLDATSVGLQLTYLDRSDGVGLFTSRSGSVTIKRMDGDRIIGSFVATLQDFLTGDTIEAEGSFDAERE